MRGKRAATGAPLPAPVSLERAQSEKCIIIACRGRRRTAIPHACRGRCSITYSFVSGDVICLRDVRPKMSIIWNGNRLHVRSFDKVANKRKATWHLMLIQSDVTRPECGCLCVCVARPLNICQYFLAASESFRLQQTPRLLIKRIDGMDFYKN